MYNYCSMHAVYVEIFFSLNCKLKCYVLDAILSYVHPVHKPILFLVNPKSGKGLAGRLKL